MAAPYTLEMKDFPASASGNALRVDSRWCTDRGGCVAMNSMAGWDNLMNHFFLISLRYAPTSIMHFSRFRPTLLRDLGVRDISG